MPGSRRAIPAGKVLRDDFPTGAHEFIPLNPGDTFPSTQSKIYLVFKLVSDSFDAVPLTARCAPEARMMTEDLERSLRLFAPHPSESRLGTWFLPLWPVRGGQTSAYSYVHEVRFRIVESRRRGYSFSLHS